MLVRSHRDDGMPPFEPVVVKGDVDDGPVGVAFHLGDIVAETVRAGDHHEVVVSEGITGEFDVPGPVRFLVEFEMKYFHWTVVKR